MGSCYRDMMTVTEESWSIFFFHSLVQSLPLGSARLAGTVSDIGPLMDRVDDNGEDKQWFSSW